MAHHHHAPNRADIAGKNLGDFRIHAAEPNHPAEEARHAVEQEKRAAAPEHKGPGIFDYKIAGFPWPFVAILSIMGLGLLGIVLKTMGLF